MLLVPPPEAADPRPLYSISHNINLFMPLSVVTDIRRGAGLDSEVVGDFEYVYLLRLTSALTRWLTWSG